MQSLQILFIKFRDGIKNDDDHFGILTIFAQQVIKNTKQDQTFSKVKLYSEE